MKSALLRNELVQQPKFEHSLAFSRNIGFVTKEELGILRKSKVAIGGMGGVGGGHLITLTRLGIENFHIADFDHFTIENFNRQYGANMGSIDRPKTEVMRAAALAINPNLQICEFAEGVTEANLGNFFDGVDLYLDGLDFFAFKARSLVYRYCEKNKIPAVMVGPIGMGASLINFLPDRMTFHNYFQWKESDSKEELAYKFLVGLTPSIPSRHYLVDRSAANLKEQRGPSTPMACDLCSGVAGTEILKILLQRGPVQCAPSAIHFDAYLNRIFRSWMPWGNRNFIQKLKIHFLRRMLAND